MPILVCCADPELTRRWLEGIGALDSVHCIRHAAEIDTLSKDPTLCQALIDLEAPGVGGIETAGGLCQRYPEIAFLFLSRRPDTGEGLALIGAGGRGYCNRYIAPELLHKAVAVVALGEVWLGRRLVDHLLQNQGSTARHAADAEFGGGCSSLTAREREVSQLVANGASNKKIAKLLGITERTVKAHMSAIFRKTDTRDRLQLGLLVRSWPAEQSPETAPGTKVQ